MKGLSLGFSTPGKEEKRVLRDHHPEISLATLRDRLLHDEALSEEEFKALLAYSSHPARHLREEALTLLLQPPVTNILSHYQDLLRFFTGGRRNLRKLAPQVWEMLCEFLAVRGQIPQEPAAALFFKHFLRHLPPAFIDTLLHQSLPLKPFLASLRLSSFGVPPDHRAAGVKRRWRLLRRQLAATPPAPSWAELTFADLGSLFGRKRGARRSWYASGRWLIQGRPLLLPPAETFPAPLGLSLRHCSWGNTDPGVRRYLDRLWSAQVEELRVVRTLAQRVSHCTRRVVLSWHNAALAASSGWAFDDLSGQFPSQTLWETFQKAVKDRLRNRQGSSCSGALGNLGKQWRQRLVYPRVHHALWEDRVCSALDLTGEEGWRQHLKAARDLLRPPDLELPPGVKGYGWPGPLSPHQRLDLPAVVAWSARHETTWHEGLLRLAALLQEGQRLLEKGFLPHLVLPWIDKFFISSRREQDWEYLTTLVDWFRGEGPRPLILFWEDTAHRQDPSLKLVLERLQGEGRPFRGIGVFDWQGSSREEALHLICREHHRIVLFALRPCSDRHNFHSLHQLLADRPWPFFQDYDSSWKDGLCFLYAGTQVFPLLSVPTDIENVPAWIAGGGARYAFGSYWRGRLREALGGKGLRSPDDLSVPYAMWANLC